jgi:hypothetical protein
MVAMSVGLVGLSGPAPGFSNVKQIASFSTAQTAWQGVGFDGTYCYVVTDSYGGGFNNAITKVDLNGNVISVWQNVYNPFPAGDFYSFGNVTVIGGQLFGGFYNANYNGASGNSNYTPLTNLLSRVAVFNITNGALITDYSLGNNVYIAEGLDFHNGYYWVIDGWFATYKVTQWDSSFNLINTFTLPVQNPFPTALTYQNLNWRGNSIFVNWHGANSFGNPTENRRVDEYSFNGTSFTWVQTLIPPAYGATQGLAISSDGTTFYWADRPGNALWSCNYNGP